VILAYALLRRDDGALVATQIVSTDAPVRFLLDERAASSADPYSPVAGARAFPWSVVRGLPRDLDMVDRGSVEALDLGLLGIEADPVGATLHLNGRPLFVTAVTRGLRPFTATPYVFTSPTTAREIVGLAPDQATFFVLDLARAACGPAVRAYVERRPGLAAHSTEDFAAMTERHWIESSGIGAVLRFGAVLALLVGMVLIGQTLSSITQMHVRELATLRALGARRRELLSFVVWQAAFLAIAGGMTGAGAAWLVRDSLAGMALDVRLDAGVGLLGAGAVLVMCAVASLGSLRAVTSIEPDQVLR
jgi:putative ABC transport system permease protein